LKINGFGMSEKSLNIFSDKMRTIQKIPIHLIDVDRLPLEPTSLQYANAIRKGNIFPPIKVAKLKNGRFKILDGRHRFLAHKLNGKQFIIAKFSNKNFIEK